jgi:serine/threonine protein kinase/tetratricopeptide (TPR) repeat protein
MGIKCPKCHFENPADTVYCGKCATPLPSSKEIPVTKTLETPKEELTTGSTFAGRYQIIEELGKGGMGEVYKVLDKEVNAKIALKLIKPEIAADKKTIERFRNELKTARDISHKNICRMYDLNKEENSYYITMEYVEGQDLKGLIRQSRQLTVGTTISIAKQVCDGLAEAHRLDVVHRDLKPQNIMIDKEGNARIMDFGIARSLKAKGITGSGVMIGTPEYMSPEQVEGKEVDQRSDIYSLGVILYEMVTGKVPFEGDTPFTIGVKHKSEAPKDPREFNVQLPEDLSRVILRCMEKDKKERYQSAGEARSELTRIEKGIPSTERVLPKRKPLTSKKEITMSFGLKKLLVPGVAIIALAIVVVIIWQFIARKEVVSEPIGKPSIAVLPFVDLSPQKDQEYFCDGMAEALLNALTSIKDLHVAARTSAFSFKGKELDIREIGKKLNVKTVLEGSVRKADERLRIAVQLINVTDGFQLWSKRYDRKVDDVFTIQDEIAQNIVQALRIELSEEEKHILGKSGTKDVQAYDFYIHGRKYFRHWHRRSTKYAIDMFTQAIKKDPGYALAYAGLADSYAHLYMYYDRSKENLDQALIASQKALELDPELAEAHVSRAHAVSQNMEYEEAEKEFETAIRLNPKLFDAYYLYGRTLRVQGKHKQAARLFEQASQVRPEDIQAPVFLVSAYEDLKLEKEAREANSRAVEVFKKHLELNPDDSRALTLGAFVLFKSNDEETAVEWMERSVSLDPEETMVLYNAACFYSSLGKVEEALDYFEKAIDSGFASREWIENDSDLDLIRNHPRFQTIMKKLK